MDTEIAEEVRALGGASRIGASDLQPGLALVWNLSSRWGFRIQRIGPCPIPRGLPTPAAVNFLERSEDNMNTTTLLIIIVLLLVLGGGGFYGRGRWY